MLRRALKSEANFGARACIRDHVGFRVDIKYAVADRSYQPDKTTNYAVTPNVAVRQISLYLKITQIYFEKIHN